MVKDDGTPNNILASGIAVFFALLICSLASPAEQYAVGIAGRLTAVDGAVITGVEVRATNQQTERRFSEKRSPSPLFL